MTAEIVCLDTFRATGKEKLPKDLRPPPSNLTQAQFLLLTHFKKNAARMFQTCRKRHARLIETGDQFATFRFMHHQARYLATGPDSGQVDIYNDVGDVALTAVWPVMGFGKRLPRPMPHFVVPDDIETPSAYATAVMPS
jgi:hypothetical protein